jgi:hypothetical protein
MHSTGLNMLISCRTLILSRPRKSQDFISTGSSLSTLIALLPRLEVFDNVAVGVVHGMDHEHVFALVQSAKDTLVSLCVSLIDGASCVTSLLLIGQLRHLRVLRVQSYYITEGDGQYLTALPPLELGELNTLKWSMPSETASLLARSHFPNLREMTLSNELESPNDVVCMGAFFAAHPGVHALCLDVETDAMTDILRLPISARTLHFTERAPPADSLLRHLPPSVRRLKLSEGAITEEEELVDLLEALYEESSLHGLKEICLASPFSWKQYLQYGPPDEEDAYLYGRVLHCATLLASKGIRVADDDGAVATISVSHAGMQ